MSGRDANTCAERKFGSATRKQIIMFLTDKATVCHFTMLGQCPAQLKSVFSDNTFEREEPNRDKTSKQKQNQ